MRSGVRAPHRPYFPFPPILHPLVAIESIHMESELREAVFAAAKRDDVSRAVSNDLHHAGRCDRYPPAHLQNFRAVLPVRGIRASAVRQHDGIGEVCGGCSCNGETESRNCPREIRPHSLPLFTPPPLAVESSCHFQMDGLCGVHDLRPFGCRIFFCDETSTQWQHDMGERLHGQLRALHDQLNVPLLLRGMAVCPQSMSLTFEAGKW